jgi:protease-4
MVENASLTDQEVEQISRWWQRGALVVLVLVGLVVGWALSAVLFPRPKVGVIHMDGEIDPYFITYYTEPLHYAAEHNDIKAVVLLVDSPGGDAATSEDLFFRILELRQKKPVVVSIQRIAASGGYYLASSGNYVYAHPAAVVGNIGVIAYMPESVPPDEEIATTGPFKGSGSSQVDFLRGLEAIKREFVANVMDQRRWVLAHMHGPPRDDILPSADRLTTGQIWTGVEAHDIGLVDELGSDLDAISKAAELAHLANYEVVDISALLFIEDGQFIFQRPSPPSDWYQEGMWPRYFDLYVPPAE